MRRLMFVTAALAVGMASFAAHTMNRPAEPVILNAGVSPVPEAGKTVKEKAAPERKAKKTETDGLTTAAIPFRVLPDRSSNEKAEATSSTGAAKAASGSAAYGAIVARFAEQYDVPEKLILAVIEIESAGQPHLVGRAGEVGLMQIKPTTARGMGYKGPTQALFDPETNIRWGMTYLAKAHDLADGDICGTILRYNAGHSAKRMNKRSAAYCRKVIEHMGS